MNSDDQFGKNIVKGGIWLSSSAFFVRVVSLVTTVIILRFLTVEEYGIYNLVLAAFGFLAAFFLSGFDPLITNDLARERGEGRHDRMRRLFVEYGVLKCVVGVVLFLVSFFGSLFLVGRFPNEIIGLLRILSFLFLFIAFERMLHLLFNVYLKFWAMSLFTIVEEIVKLALTVWLVVLEGLGARGLLYAYMFSTGVTFVLFIPYGIYLMRRLLAHPTSQEPVLLPLAAAHGKWGLASSYVADAQRSVRPWLIQTFAGTGAVGIFSLAEGIYSQLVALVPLSNLLAPLLPREIHNRERMQMVMNYGIRYGTLLFAALGVAAFFGVPILLEWFFPHYLPAVPVFRIMIVALLITAAANIVNTILFSYREQRTLFLLVLVRLLFLIFSASLLLSLFGVIGIAIEFVLTAVFFVAIRYWSLLKVAPDLRVSFRQMVSFRRSRGGIL